MLHTMVGMTDRVNTQNNIDLTPITGFLRTLNCKFRRLIFVILLTLEDDSFD